MFNGYQIENADITIPKEYLVRLTKFLRRIEQKEKEHRKVLLKDARLGGQKAIERLKQEYHLTLVRPE